MAAIEGQDFSDGVTQGDAASTVVMEQIEPLEDGQAELYERAFKQFQEARQNLEALLIAGGFSDKDIVKAEFQGDNKHFVTKPSNNGKAG
jgi:enamine deaminase RidA (YjgF/YER057c/UK114 family)